MTQFKLTNVYVEYDDNYSKAEDPKNHQLVSKGNPSRIAAQWESDVLGLLEDFYLHSKLSRLLFDAIQRAGFNPKSGKHDRRLIIKPYTYQLEKSQTVCNAIAAAHDGGADPRETMDGTLAGKGDGPGSSATIYYDKARWCTGAPCGPAPGTAGGAADEVLLHEMLHSLRVMAGQQDRSKIGGGYDNLEE